MGTLVAVARGELVHLGIATLKDYLNHPGYTLVPIDGMPLSSAGLVWLTRRENAAIRAFAQIAQTMTERAQQPANPHGAPALLGG